MTIARRVLYRFLRATGLATGLPVPAVDQGPGMCGPASLKAVLAYYGVEKTEDELKQLSGATEEDGVPPEGIVRAAKALGFRAYFKQNASLEELKGWLGKKVPVIIDWYSTDEGHYSVLTAIQDGNVYMKDPELGTEREMPLDKFERVWFDFDSPSKEHKGLGSRQIVVILPPA